MTIVTRMASPRNGMWLAFVVVFVIACIAFFLQLGKAPIGNSDEGIHALVTRQMREGGDWLTLHFKDDPYFRKPPLSFWLRGITQNVLGEREFTDRLPSALAGVGTALVVAAWAWRWTRKRSVMLFAAAALVLIPSTFTHTFRTGEADGLLIFLTTTTAFFLWLSVGKPWYLVAGAASIALAFMTKNVAAGAVPLAFILALAVMRKWPYRWKHVVAAIVVFVAIAAPWHIYQWKTHGTSFWGEYIGFHVIERVETKLHVTPLTHGPFWYIRGVTQGMFPWSFLIVPAAALSLVTARRREGDRFPEMFLLAWGLGTVALFSLAATKLAWYVAPAFPAFALLIGRFVAAPFIRMPRWLQILTAIFIAAGEYEMFRLYRTGVSRFFTLSFLKPVVAMSVIALVAAILLFLAYRRSRTTGDRTLGALMKLTVAFFFLISIVVFSRYLRLNGDSPFRVFRNEIVARNPAADVYIFDNGIFPSPLTSIYLAGEHQQRSVTALLKKTPTLEAVLATKHGAFVVFERQSTVPASYPTQLVTVRDYADKALYQVR